MNKKIVKICLAFVALAEVLVHQQIAIGEDVLYRLGSKKRMLISDTLCGYISTIGKWKVVDAVSTENGTRYRIDAAASDLEKSRCKRLPGAGQISSLKRLPSPSKLTKAAQTNAARLGVVSGTPPTLTELSSGEADVGTTFWQPGVIDAIVNGEASPDQCNQFWAGQQDGHSGGFAACFLTEGVGRTFETIEMGGTSLCYMKNAPTQANVDAGAVRLISGQLPNNNIAELFTPGSSANRLVRVDIEGDEFGEESVFIKVYSSENNTAEGYHYRYDLWFCAPNQTSPNEIENTTIRLNGAYRSSMVGQHQEEGGAFRSVINAFIRMSSDGRPVFDNAQNRRAVVAFEGSEMSFKSDLLITPTNEIRFKTYDVFGEEARKGYSIAEFSGTNLSNLRFRAGGNKTFEVARNETHRVATEFRDTYYAAAPDSEFHDALDTVDFDQDEFYQSPGSVTINNSGYSCSAIADVVVGLNMGNAAMQQVMQICEGERMMEGGAFCFQNESLQQAMNQWFSSCEAH